MKLTACHTIAAPAAFVFRRATRFGRAERAVRADGGRIWRMRGRIGEGPEAEAQPKWQVRIPFRGKERAFTLDLDRRDEGRVLSFAIVARSVTGRFTVLFSEIEPPATGPGPTLPAPADPGFAGRGDGAVAQAALPPCSRMELHLLLEPRTLKARMVLGSAGLMQMGLERRMAARLAAFAATTETRWQAHRGQ